LLDVGGQQREVHELGDPGPGQLEVPGRVGLVAEVAPLDRGSEAVGEGKHLGHAGRAADGVVDGLGLGRLLGEDVASAAALAEEVALEHRGVAVFLLGRLGGGRGFVTHRLASIAAGAGAGCSAAGSSVGSSSRSSAPRSFSITVTSFLGSLTITFFTTASMRRMRLAGDITSQTVSKVLSAPLTQRPSACR